ncbi:hypothetical protein [Pontibacter sp. SGAir0037]|uniref:hypothetical protein n=1 Tax=Pontibacter sp. SGAir0037 TaxID=2571030 RepID=UPI0010CD0A8A|nr:hypothetical protein [Pontibacter sp. SGAir0037]QCR21564.1 hypothetical protein C1N53_03845 [Pontibacter sp. SGAir0037]
MKWFLMFLVCSIGRYTPALAASMASAEVLCRQDKTIALVGEVVTVQVQVKAPTADSVSWQLFDRPFELLLLLQKNSSERNLQHTFEHEVKFTSVKGGGIRFAPLRVLVYQQGKADTLEVETFEVTFKPEPLIAALHDIKPLQSNTGMPLLLTAGLLVAIPCLLLLLVVLLIKLYKSSTSTAYTPEQLRQQALEQLQLLEEKWKQHELSERFVLNSLAEIWSHYIQQVYQLPPSEKAMENVTAQLGSSRVPEAERRQVAALSELQEKYKFTPESRDLQEMSSLFREARYGISQCPGVVQQVEVAAC